MGWTRPYGCLDAIRGGLGWSLEEYSSQMRVHLIPQKTADGANPLKPTRFSRRLPTEQTERGRLGDGGGPAEAAQRRVDGWTTAEAGLRRVGGGASEARARLLADPGTTNSATEEDEREQDGADDERQHGGGGAAALIGRQQQWRGMRLLLVPLHGSGQCLCFASAGTLGGALLCLRSQRPEPPAAARWWGLW